MSDIIDDVVRRIIIQIEDETLEQLDDAAGESGESRAGFIRRAIEEALAERAKRREFDRIAESFRRRPPDALTGSKASRRRAWPD